MQSPHASSSSRRPVLQRLLVLAWQYRARCALVLGVQLAALGCTLLGLGASGLALDVLRHALTADVPAPAWLPAWRPLQLLLALALGVLLLGVLRALLGYLYTVAVADLVQARIVPSVRAQLYERLQQLSFRFYDRQDSGSLLNRVTSDVQALRAFIDMVLIQGAVVLLALLVYGVYMTSRHAGLTALCLASTPLLWLATTRYSRRVMPAHDASRKRLDELVLGVSEAVQGVQVVKSFAQEDAVLGRLMTRNARVRDGQQEIFELNARYTPAVDLLGNANLVLLLSYGGLLVLRGQLTLGDLLVFAGLVQQVNTQVTTLSTIINTLQESLVAARRVFEVLDTPPEVTSPPSPRALPQPLGRVRFEDVTFRYAGGPPALEHVSFEAAPGELIALYGAAGAGKTSLLSLIPRFYDPDHGRVTVDGIPLGELDLHCLRRHVAVVFQETFLFSHTVAANIAFGQPTAEPAEIERAARLASAHEFIARLPHGYDTVLGELAQNLSGGQRQRLALARALLTDPRILLLDDPTAALDAETTREVLESLRSAARGRTTFLVTHRPALLRRADRILVLERGRIVQQGSHSQLCLEPGPYRELLQLQDHGLPAQERAS